GSAPPSARRAGPAWRAGGPRGAPARSRSRRLLERAPERARLVAHLAQRGHGLGPEARADRRRAARLGRARLVAQAGLVARLLQVAADQVAQPLGVLDPGQHGAVAGPARLLLERGPPARRVDHHVGDPEPALERALLDLE